MLGNNLGVIEEEAKAAETLGAVANWGGGFPFTRLHVRTLIVNFEK